MEYFNYIKTKQNETTTKKKHQPAWVEEISKKDRCLKRKNKQKGKIQNTVRAKIPLA